MKSGWWVALAFVAIGSPAEAQYRWRDTNGQTNYGDLPPSDARDLQRVDARGPMTPNDPNAALPFELRRALASYPALLYTSDDCPPCDSARVFLRQRGVPYSERIVDGADDTETLRRLTGSDKVPVLMLGKQGLAGFSAPEWGRGLDAAGYPAESRLPPGYAGEPPQPLVPRASGPANLVGPAPLAR
jgi:glutaredoxin